MPNAVNIPFTSMLDPETKTFKSPEAIKESFKAEGIDLESDKPLVASCGSGKQHLRTETYYLPM